MTTSIRLENKKHQMESPPSNETEKPALLLVFVKLFARCIAIDKKAAVFYWPLNLAMHQSSTDIHHR
jgi:hypothetical protein